MVDPYKIYCANCKTHLYNYIGEFVGPFRPSSFIPVGAAIQPGFHKPCACYKCGAPWYMLRRNGSIVCVTNHGMKPNPPKGTRHVVLAALPEVPPRSQEDEFKDPSEIKRADAETRDLKKRKK